jgi:hypothetical protein
LDLNLELTRGHGSYSLTYSTFSSSEVDPHVGC